MQNISRSFPEKKYKEIQCIAKNFYKFLAILLVEAIKRVSLSPKQVDRQILSKDAVCLIDSYAFRQKNVILACGHFGNWEMLDLYLGRLKSPSKAVYKPLRNRIFDRLMCYSRCKFGWDVLTNQEIGRYIIKNKNTATNYLLIADQYPGKTDAIYHTQFLNQETSFFPGIEKLSKAVDAVVIFVAIVPVGKHKYKVVAELLTEDPKECKPGFITQEYASALEKVIKQYPSCWLWSHKRWK